MTWRTNPFRHRALLLEHLASSIKLVVRERLELLSLLGAVGRVEFDHVTPTSGLKSCAREMIPHPRQCRPAQAELFATAAYGLMYVLESVYGICVEKSSISVLPVCSSALVTKLCCCLLLLLPLRLCCAAACCALDGWVRTPHLSVHLFVTLWFQEGSDFITRLSRDNRTLRHSHRSDLSWCVRSIRCWCWAAARAGLHFDFLCGRCKCHMRLFLRSIIFATY